VAREYGVSKYTIYAWKAKYGGMEVSEAEEVKHLRDENGRLKKRVCMKMCNRCASLVRSSILSKLCSFSGIDFTFVFRLGSKSAASVAERFTSGIRAR
jgi:hypothetical protein